MQRDRAQPRAGRPLCLVGGDFGGIGCLHVFLQRRRLFLVQVVLDGVLHDQVFYFVPAADDNGILAEKEEEKGGRWSRQQAHVVPELGALFFVLARLHQQGAAPCDRHPASAQYGE